MTSHAMTCTSELTGEKLEITKHNNDLVTGKIYLRAVGEVFSGKKTSSFPNTAALAYSGTQALLPMRLSNNSHNAKQTFKINELPK